MYLFIQVAVTNQIFRGLKPASRHYDAMPPGMNASVMPNFRRVFQ